MDLSKAIRLKLASLIALGALAAVPMTAASDFAVAQTRQPVSSNATWTRA
jgi:hypothetical protein